MENQNKRNFAAIILAAGKGKRMQMETGNKVTAKIGEKPMIAHIVDFIKHLAIEKIIVVVGHHKQSVIDALSGYDITFAHQEHLLGTGDAVNSALTVIPENTTDVLIVYGDDVVLYNGENLPTIKKLFTLHEQTNDGITLLTIDQDNPTALGRIVRDEHDKIKAIVEEKDATNEEKKITEINPGCFLFSVAFLKEYLPQLSQSSVTGEYYLTQLIALAIQNGCGVNAVKGGKMRWRGINTREELAEAEKLFQSNKN